MRSRPTSLAFSLFAALALVSLSACSDDDPTSPGGNPDGDLEVELRNFTTTTWEMGLEGQSLILIEGSVSTGNPTPYRVVNPGVGNSLTFVAELGSDTRTATCTVTSSTNATEPPQVVLQPAFDVLQCVSW